MGREEEVEALRRRIIREATRRFADAGYGATSIQQIADAVGIGKTLVLYHFPSKEALRAEVVSEVAAAWQSFLPELAESMKGHASAPAPEAVIRAVARFLRANPDLPRFILRELLDTRGEVARLLAEQLGPATAAAAALVERGPDGAHGGARGACGDAHAQMVLAGLMLLTVLAVFKPGEDGELVGPDPEVKDGLGERLLEAAIHSVSGSLASG